MGYFSKQVGQCLGVVKGDVEASSASDGVSPICCAPRPHFAANVGRPLSGQTSMAQNRCPRCGGVLAEDDGYFCCGGRCGRRWLAGGPGCWRDPATAPFGACSCCTPRLALTAAEIGAVCPATGSEYLVLPEGVRPRDVAAPLGICRCCLPPQPLAQTPAGLVCRNKPQQRYGVANGAVIWLGTGPALDQAAVTAAIDAALHENSAELTLFGLFVPSNTR